MEDCPELQDDKKKYNPENCYFDSFSYKADIKLIPKVVQVHYDKWCLVLVIFCHPRQIFCMLATSSKQ